MKPIETIQCELMIASQESTTIADRVSARLSRFRFFQECTANEMDVTATKERIITHARLAQISKT